MTTEAPVKVSTVTRERARLAATLLKCTQRQVLDQAMAEFIERHADEMSVGIDRARKALLGGDAEMLAYVSGASREDIERLGGTGASQLAVRPRQAIS